jgi:hypothetical protein
VNDQKKNLSSGGPQGLAELLDKQAITEVLYRRVRASDRGDAELALSCYHEGALEEHEGFSGTAAGFIKDHALSAPGSTAKVTCLWHALTNVSIELVGIEAQVESYYFAIVIRSDADHTTHCQIGGRYLDAFAYRDSRWAITHRTVVYDWSALSPEGPSYWDLIGRDPTTIITGQFGAGDPLYDVLGIARG